MAVIFHYDEIFNTPVGYIGVNREDNKLTGLTFLGPELGKNKGRLSRLGDNEIGRALGDYFKNPTSIKRPPTVLHGTDFQKEVWQLMAAIAPGKTRTYGDIAQELNTSPRAVGNACRSNPVPIFIPCHRVVSKTGNGGFMGRTDGNPIAIKGWLLEHEKNTNRNQ